MGLQGHGGTMNNRVPGEVATYRATGPALPGEVATHTGRRGQGIPGDRATSTGRRGHRSPSNLSQ